SRGAMGEEHPLTLRVARNLAVCRRRDGALDEAAKLSEETLRRFVARYGAGHADSLATAINLSVDLRLAGDHEQSRALGEDTAGRYAALLGENHAYTLLTRINLAATLRAIPRLDAAHEVEEDTVHRLSATLGDLHVITRTAAIGQANTAYAQLDFERAHAIDEANLPLLAEVAGEDHPLTLSCLANLSLDLRGLGRGAEADEAQRKAVEGFNRVVRADHPWLTAAQIKRRIECDLATLPLSDRGARGAGARAWHRVPSAGHAPPPHPATRQPGSAARAGAPFRFPGAAGVPTAGPAGRRTRPSSGWVSSVVIRAMNTSTLYSGPLSRPARRPASSAISSVSPRALSSTPTVRASSRPRPPSRAVSVPLPTLVTTARTVTTSTAAQPAASMPSRVTERPETTKKNGSSSDPTSCRGRTRSGSRVPPGSRGVTTPASSAPKMTCSPRECVTQADPRAKPMSSARRSEGSTPVRHSSRRSTGRAATVITATKANARAARQGSPSA